MGGVGLVISNAYLGLVASAAEYYPEARWGIVRLKTNWSLKTVVLRPSGCKLLPLSQSNLIWRERAFGRPPELSSPAAASGRTDVGQAAMAAASG